MLVTEQQDLFTKQKSPRLGFWPEVIRCRSVSEPGVPQTFQEQISVLSGPAIWQFPPHYTGDMQGQFYRLKSHRLSPKLIVMLLSPTFSVVRFFCRPLTYCNSARAAAQRVSSASALVHNSLSVDNAA